MVKKVMISQITLKTGFLLVTIINALNNAKTESAQNKTCVMFISLLRLAKLNYPFTSFTGLSPNAF